MVPMLRFNTDLIIKLLGWFDDSIIPPLSYNHCHPMLIYTASKRVVEDGGEGRKIHCDAAAVNESHYIAWHSLYFICPALHLALCSSVHFIEVESSWIWINDWWRQKTDIQIWQWQQMTAFWVLRDVFFEWTSLCIWWWWETTGWMVL